MSKIAFK